MQLRHSYPAAGDRRARSNTMASPMPPHDPSDPRSNAGSTPQPNAPAWQANMNTFPVNSGGTGPSYPQFSASTAAILERLQGRPSGGTASGSAAFEAKKAEILQNYVTSDKLPTPPPIVGGPRRGRGGKVGTPGTPKVTVASPAVASGRVSARGRGRGRGRGGGRRGKRKRRDSDEDDDVSVSNVSSTIPSNMLHIGQLRLQLQLRHLRLIHPTTHPHKIRPQRQQARNIRAHHPRALIARRQAPEINKDAPRSKMQDVPPRRRPARQPHRIL